MAVLYTVGNINLQTVELVAKAIKESEPQIMIRRVVIFDSAESEKLQNEQRFTENISGAWSVRGSG